MEPYRRKIRAAAIMGSGLQFEWDQRKAAPKIVKHGVSFQESATVFGEALGRIVTDPRHSSEEERLVLLGISQDKRLLGAMFRRARRGNSNHQCRRATRGERKHYEENPE